MDLPDGTQAWLVTRYDDVTLVLYGSSYWEQVLRFEPFVEFGTISPEDLALFHRSDTVDDAFGYLTSWLTQNVLNDSHAPGIYAHVQLRLRIVEARHAGILDPSSCRPKGKIEFRA